MSMYDIIVITIERDGTCLVLRGVVWWCVFVCDEVCIMFLLYDVMSSVQSEGGLYLL